MRIPRERKTSINLLSLSLSLSLSPFVFCSVWFPWKSCKCKTECHIEQTTYYYYQESTKWRPWRLPDAKINKNCVYIYILNNCLDVFTIMQYYQSEFRVKSPYPSGSGAVGLQSSSNSARKSCRLLICLQCLVNLQSR